MPPSLWLTYTILAVAIVSEVTATTALKAADGFTRLWPSLLVIAGYGMALWLLSLTLRILPVGIVYAIWAGVGVALTAIAGMLVYGQRLDAAALVGIGLIIAGVAVINLWSATIPR